METPSKHSHTPHEPMHEEIKRRAYYFWEHKGAGTSSPNLDEELKGEWPRIVYALSTAQECSGAVDASAERACRAARIYLRALSSFVTRFQL